MPVKELRRLARGRQVKGVAAVYRLASFGPSARLFLLLSGALSAAGIILMAFGQSQRLGFLAALAVIWLVWAGRTPKRAGGGRLQRSAILAAPLFTAGVSLFQPLLGRLTRRQRSADRTAAAGLYEKEDLADFMKSQARLGDNRIAEQDLKLAAAALSFSDKTVAAAMVPRRQVKWITAAEHVGPMVADELHQSGQTIFPVVKEVVKTGNPEVVGSLYLSDLLGRLETKGRIRDLMQTGVNYVNESQSLHEALETFLQTGSGLLIVINDFEEIVGVLTLGDIFKQIFGKEIG